MPNDIIVSNIKKQLESKKNKQNNLKNKKLLFADKFITDFNTYILAKLENNNFEILSDDDSYYITETYNIVNTLFDPFFLDKKDIDYLANKFKSKLTELIGINNINVQADITRCDTFPSQYIDFNIKINLNEIDNL